MFKQTGTFLGILENIINANVTHVCENIINASVKILNTQSFHPKKFPLKDFLSNLLFPEGSTIV